MRYMNLKRMLSKWKIFTGVQIGLPTGTNPSNLNATNAGLKPSIETSMWIAVAASLYNPVDNKNAFKFAVFLNDAMVLMGVFDTKQHYMIYSALHSAIV